MACSRCGSEDQVITVTIIDDGIPLCGKCLDVFRRRFQRFMGERISLLQSGKANDTPWQRIMGVVSGSGNHRRGLRVWTKN